MTVLSETKSIRGKEDLFSDEAKVIVNKIIKDVYDKTKEALSVCYSHQNESSEHLKVTYAYLQWLGSWREFLTFSDKKDVRKIDSFSENALREFSLQVAYAFFIKVFILRVLEDKGLIDKISSNGSLEEWKKITDRLSILGEKGRIRFDLLFRFAIESVKESIFVDVEKNPIYDWYSPDDMLFLEVLEFLNSYNFQEIDQDIIGFLYQKLMEQEHRHNLGVYLTPVELVDYILDRTGYIVGNKEIIGVKVLDPACGSGTFLVRAVRRYKETLKILNPNDYEKKFIEDVQNNFWGVDLNAFSIYLASINLFIQVLEEIVSLKNKGETLPVGITFNLYVGNTFRLYDKLKEKGFYYIFANPPYVNAKRADFEPPEEILRILHAKLGGDKNSYSIFLAMSMDFLANTGKLGFVVPLTLLADLQTEKLRRAMEKEGNVLHITRFYNRNVLFEGVSQAVIVFVWQKGGTSTEISISWSNEKANERSDVINSARENLVTLQGGITYKLLDSGGQQMQLHSKDYTFWVVLGGRSNSHVLKLYDILNNMLKMNKSFKELLCENNINPDIEFRQGDINTTSASISQYSASGTDPNSVALYKGEDIRPFGKLPLEPKGVKHNNVLVKYIVCRQKKPEEVYRITTLKKPEWVIIFNEVVLGSDNHPRNIRGLVEFRDSQRRFVLAHTSWVIRTPDERTAKKIACLIFSLPFNFQYNSFNTNQHISKKPLLLLRVPDTLPEELVDLYDKLNHIWLEFTKLGIEDITEFLDPLWYSLKPGIIEEKLFSWDYLTNNITPKIKLYDFLLRYAKQIKTPKGEKVSSYLKFWEFNVEDENAKKAKRVIDVFSLHYGDENYSTIENKELMPLNLDDFEKKLDDAIWKLKKLLDEWTETLKNLDQLLLDAYQLKNTDLNDFLVPLSI